MRDSYHPSLYDVPIARVDFYVSMNSVLEQRFWSKILLPEDDEDCWLWEGALSDGYGEMIINIGASPAYAHRLSYELHYGSIPDGMEIDHLCETRNCVNPLHLEAVSHIENVRRSLEMKQLRKLWGLTKGRR
jgi:hypothetical protein